MSEEKLPTAVRIAREYEEKNLSIEQIDAEITDLIAQQVELNYRVKFLEVRKVLKGLEL